LFRWSSNPTVRLISLSISPGRVERIRVTWNSMRCLWLDLCSATADLPGCPSYMYRWCPCCGLYRSTSLSDVYLTTLAGYAVNPRSSKSQVVLHRTTETGDLPKRQANSFNVCLASILLGRPYVVRTYGRKANKVGYSCDL
jgi:hypothetical protein